MRWQARPRRREPSRARFHIEELEGRALLSVTAQSFTIAALENTTRAIDLAPYVQDSASNPTLTFSIVSPTTADGGHASVRDPAGGMVAYTPPSGNSPFQDSFTYTVEDQDGDTAQGQVTLDVASVAANSFIQGELEGQASIAVTIAQLPGAVQDIRAARRTSSRTSRSRTRRVAARAWTIRRRAH